MWSFVGQPPGLKAERAGYREEQRARGCMGARGCVGGGGGMGGWEGPVLVSDCCY